MKMFYVEWLFVNEKIAKEAINMAIEDEEVASSFGVGDKQYQGFDFSEGEISYSTYEIDDKQLCKVTWLVEAQNTDEDYWLTPYCFENVDTFSFNGGNIKGEECNFGIKEKANV